jgi:hypothetical protein
MVAVRRVLFAIVFLLVGSACAIGFLPTTPSEAAPEGRAWTHRITSLTGEYVDRWTLNDPEPCGLVGDGTVTVKFKMAVNPRVALVYSRFASAEPSGYGSWIVGIPSAHGGGLVSAPPRPGAGTITLVDNTVQNPPEPGARCAPHDKTACGTKALSRPMVSFTGYNRRFLEADLAAQLGGRNGCLGGQNDRFTNHNYTGGTRLGELLLGMPSMATVSRRRVLVLTGTSRKKTSLCEYADGTCSDDITRRVTATLKKL